MTIAVAGGGLVRCGNGGIWGRGVFEGIPITRGYELLSTQLRMVHFSEGDATCVIERGKRAER